jgi:hypothetical protein
MRRVLIQEHIRHIKDQFRKALGRDLTPAEERYLALSVKGMPDDDIHLVENNRRKPLRVNQA